MHHHHPMPAADPSTYRDLLLFEERLKSNASNLQKRKRRYQLFLLNLILMTLLLLAEVGMLQPTGSSLLAGPYALIMSRLLGPPPSETESGSATGTERTTAHCPQPARVAMLNPYVASGLLFVNATALVLFFASGMYRDKIAYANRYVPQANRALRSFNMYLNVRKPPLRSRFSLLFSRSPPSQQPQNSPPSPLSRSQGIPPANSHPMNPIPPASNPRGELIFSSRVDKGFREGYEKHRATFERKRQEKEERDRQGKRGAFWGWLMIVFSKSLRFGFQWRVDGKGAEGDQGQEQEQKTMTTRTTPSPSSRPHSQSHSHANQKRSASLSPPPGAVSSRARGSPSPHPTGVRTVPRTINAPPAQPRSRRGLPSAQQIWT